MNIGTEVNSLEQLSTKKVGKKLANKESDVVKSCLQVLAMKGIFAWRNNTGAVISMYKGKKRFIKYGCKGSPDIIGIMPNGKFIGVECKKVGGKQSDDQRDFQSKVGNGIYIVVESGSELLNYLHTKWRFGVKKDKKKVQELLIDALQGANILLVLIKDRMPVSLHDSLQKQIESNDELLRRARGEPPFKMEIESK